jgi:adenosylhomocysteine nucleosidase
MILIATGLKREARLLAGPDARVIAGGGDSRRLERELDAAAAGAGGVISIGLCGALAEGLAPGDWVVASELVLAGTGPAGPYRNFLPVRKWGETLAGRLGARFGPVLGSDAMLADADAKRAAHEATGAIAVDMESHVAAAVAARHGLPFAVARVVSDAADRSLPRAAQAGMAADGRMDVLAVLRALAADPRQLPSLIRVGAEAETAFRALGRGRDLLGPGLGRPDLAELALDMV